MTIVNFGDGATSIGAIHEAMNLAGVWKLPVIFLCQNNQFGEHTIIPDYTASTDFASRAKTYGFAGVKLDANDVAGFYRGMTEVIAEVRGGNGPRRRPDNWSRRRPPARSMPWVCRSAKSSKRPMRARARGRRRPDGRTALTPLAGSGTPGPLIRRITSRLGRPGGVPLARVKQGRNR